jgi:hypothetical protein
MRAIRLQYSVSHEAFFYCADSISASAIRFKPVVATNLHRAPSRFAAEPATASRGIVGALNKKADVWRR